jgi:hypothetical protein
MGKFTLTFDTETEADAIKRHMAVDEMANILFEITHNLKNNCIKKLDDADVHGDVYDGVDLVIEEILDIIENNNIDITEL